MFPRISKSTKNGRAYEYLVISESIHVRGKGSTTRNVANLGNIKRFSNQDVTNLIDGFIRIFKLENYCLSEDVEIFAYSDGFRHLIPIDSATLFRSKAPPPHSEAFRHPVI